jgi:hypothetical protein
MRRVLTAELRGVADETVTLAIDAADTPKIDPETEYRLVTLPVTDRPDREFASLLRAADETFSSVTVEAGSPLHGLPVAALDLAVVAVEPDGEPVATLPEPLSLLAPGDVVYVVARPEALRRLERAAERLDLSIIGHGAASNPPPAESGQPTSPQSEQATDGSTDDPHPETGTAEEEPESDDTGETHPSAGSETDEATGDDDPRDDPTGGQAGSESFQELAEQFESGEADWDDSDHPPGDETTADDAVAEGTPNDEDADGSDEDDLFGENAGLEDVTFETDPDDSEGAADDSGLDDISFDDAEDETDDLTALGGDTESDDADDTDGDSGSDDDDDGGTSFQQLKEEFESGEADWEDEVSDSPGGDMRLDE